MLAMTGFVWFALQHADALAGLLFDRRWAAVISIACAGIAVYGVALVALGGIRRSDYKAYSRNRKSF